MAWHTVAGAFIFVMFVGALGFGVLTAILAATAKAWIAVVSGLACVACVLTIPYLFGYVATGVCGVGPCAGREQP